ncbi:MAG TPA: OmpA family protein [Stellaceae bacterium]
MAFRLPRRLRFGCKRPFGRRWNVVALIGLSALLISSATAQIATAGQSDSAVSVDYSVLERLGPPPVPGRLLLAENTSAGAIKRQVATTPRAHTRSAVTIDYSALDHLGPTSASPLSGKRNPGASKRQVAVNHPTGHKTAAAKARPSGVAKAPIKTASSLNRIIHLTPPNSRVASAAPTRPAAAGRQAISHHAAAISTPSKTSPPLAKFVPAAVPKPLASRETPTPPVVPLQQARAYTPPAAVAPPSEPVVAARPLVPATATTQAATPPPSPTRSSTAPPDTPAPVVTARAATPAPSSIETPAAPAAMTIAATPPATAITPTAPPAAVAPPPPVQIAAATTVGSADTAVKFKPGVTDLGGGDQQPALDAVVNRLLANQALRIELISHATGTADDAMEARRVSLARAIAVRGYLIDKGVRSLRINVRALGNHADSGPVTDQVDLLVVSQ